MAPDPFCRQQTRDEVVLGAFHKLSAFSGAKGVGWQKSESERENKTFPPPLYESLDKQKGLNPKCDWVEILHSNRFIAV